MAAPAPSDANLNSICQEYLYDELVSATDSFSRSRDLGHGTYGVVSSGMLQDGTEVAVKALAKPHEAGFRAEVEVLSRLRHPNLVILIGFARNHDRRYLVYELMSGGDVCERLQGDGAFNWWPRLTVALDAALGLSHLHGHRPRVFHRDIKSQNILLDRSNTGKVADFGLALLASPSAVGALVEQTSGTLGYADPKYIRTGLVTEGSEVYSYGMVLLEEITRHPPAVQQPHTGRVTYQFDNLDGQVARVEEIADRRACWPDHLCKDIAHLALQCVQGDEDKRPKFVNIVRSLRRLVDQHRPPGTGMAACRFTSFSDGPPAASAASSSGIPGCPAAAAAAAAAAAEGNSVHSWCRRPARTPCGLPDGIDPTPPAMCALGGPDDDEHDAPARLDCGWTSAADNLHGVQDTLELAASQRGHMAFPREAVGNLPQGLAGAPKGAPPADSDFILGARDACSAVVATSSTATTETGYRDDRHLGYPRAARRPFEATGLSSAGTPATTVSAPVTTAGSAAEAAPPTPELSEDFNRLVVELGFNRAHVLEASKRCSTAESAVEWILAPDRPWSFVEK